MAEYQSIFTGQEVDNALSKLRSWIAADATTKPTDGTDTNISTVTIDGSSYAVLWKVVPTSSNTVYGLGLHTTTGRIYQICADRGLYTALSLDSNSDTRNTAGSANSDAKLLLVGAGSQNANGVTTYTNTNVFEQSGNLYASSVYVGSGDPGDSTRKKLATEEYVTTRGYTTNEGTVTSITMNSNTKSQSGGVVNLGDVVTGGTVQYAHPSFTGNTNTTTDANEHSGGTATVASSTHTHGISLTSNNSNVQGSIAYIEASGGASGTTQYAGAAFTGDSANTSVTAPNSGGTTSVASSTHIHTISVGFETGATQAAAEAALATATASDSTSIPASVKYLEDITVTSKNLSGTFSGTSAITTTPNYPENYTGVEVPTGAHTHTYTPAGSVSLEGVSTQGAGPQYIYSIDYEAPTAATTPSVAKADHVHSYTPSGSINLDPTSSSTKDTSDVNNPVEFVESVTLPVATATGTAAISGHTHTYDKTTSVTLTIDNESGGVVIAKDITGSAASGDPTTKYLHWSAGTTPASSATPTYTDTDTENDSGNGQAVASTAHRHSYTTYSLTGSNTTHTPKYMKFNAGTTPKASATVNYDDTAATGTATTLTGSETKYLTMKRSTSGSGTSARRTLSIKGSQASDTAAALNMNYIESTSSSTHTHTYSKTSSVTLNNGTAPSMNFNTNNSSDFPYVAAMNDSSLALSPSTEYTGAPYKGASNESASATVASHSHTHSYKKTTGVTLNAGTAPSLISNETAANGIKYLQEYEVSGGSWSAVTTRLKAAPNHTSTLSDGKSTANTGTVTAVTAIGNGDVTTKYLHPKFTGGTANTVATGSGSTTTVVGSLTSGTFDITNKWMTASFTGSSGLSTQATASRVDVAPASHTHNVTATGNITLYDNAGGNVSVISSITHTPQYFIAAPSIGSPSDSGTLVATAEHTHTVTPAGTVALSLAENTATGKIGVITGVSSGTDTVKYLTASTGSAVGTETVASQGHSHEVVPTGTVSLGLDNVSTGDAIVTGLDKN